MDFLKEFFESEGTDKGFDAFSKWCKEKGYKLADLGKGEYETKAKAERVAKEREEKLAAEYEAKIKAEQEKYAKIEAEYKEKEEKYAAEAKEKEAKAAATMTEGERTKKELQDQIDKLTKLNETATKQQEKHTKEIEAIRAEGETAKQQGIRDKREALYMKAGGKEKNVSRDIDFLTKQITDDTPFETVLENYKKESPELFTSETTKVSTLPILTGEEKAAQDKEEAAARRGAGLPPEKSD